MLLYKAIYKACLFIKTFRYFIIIKHLMIKIGNSFGHLINCLMWIYLNETIKSFHPHQNTDPFWNMFSRTTLNGDFIFENLNVFYLEVRQRIFKRSCSGFSTLVKQFVCAHEERGWRSFLFSVCNSFNWQTTDIEWIWGHAYIFRLF